MPAKKELANTHDAYASIARKAQKIVEILIILILSSAVGIALVSALIVLFPAMLGSDLVFDAFISLFVVGIASQIFLQTTHLENRWFQARAVAETAKSLLWEYAMGAISPRGEKGPEQRLMHLLREARDEYTFRGWLFRAPGGEPSPSLEIPAKMMQLHSSQFSESKIHEYLTGRLDNQINWYVRKSLKNRKLARFYGVLAIAIEFAGISLAVSAYLYHVIGTEGILALIAVLVTSLVGWAQSRRYAELIEPYRYTSENLKELMREFVSCDEPRFKILVERAEKAISREHQMWKLRRDVSVQKHLRDEPAEKEGEVTRFSPAT